MVLPSLVTMTFVLLALTFISFIVTLFPTVEYVFPLVVLKVKWLGSLILTVKFKFLLVLDQLAAPAMLEPP